MSEPIVAREVAEKDFERMCHSRRIEVSLDEMPDDEARKSFSERKSKIVAAIMSGRLMVAENGDPTYQPATPGARAVTFHPATGATFMSMDRAEGMFTRMTAAMTEMTRTNPGELSRLHAVDYRLCMELANLFLAQ